MSSIVFIDSRVQDYERLISGFGTDVQVVLLDPAQDGIAQIAAAVAGATNLDSIHIVSHGSSGTLYLGSTVLTEDSLDDYEEELAQIGASLSEEGDLLLYGCNAGAGEVGERFIASLAAYTGADVAASTDLTGSAAAGGDWVLEAATGGIEAVVPFDAMALEAYAYTLLADGSLDTTFGGDGKVTTAIGSGDDGAASLTLQGDGRIVVAGNSLNGTTLDFALARYNANGSLDTTFSGDGKVITPIGAGHDFGNSLTLQSDGKIVVAGKAFHVTDYDFALARYNANGSLDTTFDGDGKLTTNREGEDQINDIALQPDGRIVVAGWSVDGANYDFALARYNTNGSLDTTFDGDGRLTTGIGTNNDLAVSLALQSDGKIVVAGLAQSSFSGPYDFGLARYNTNGSLDTTFSGDGKVTTAIGTGDDQAFDLALQSDGKILVAGYSYNGANSDFALARYNTDGSLDTTFDGDGKLTTAIGTGDDRAGSLALQSDGRIVVAGYSYNGVNNDFALARYNTDGSLDTTFDGDGKLTVAVGTGADSAVKVAIQSDGNIIVGGTSSGDFAVIRVLGSQSIEGGAGDDTLDGGSGRDTLSGLAGEDTLDGGSGDDTLIGGAGNDTLIGGTGKDTADYVAAAGAVTVNLATGTATGGAGNDTLTGVENVRGSAFLDTLTGNGGANALYGESGADTLNGGGGRDTLDGGAGVDSMRGGSGSDLYFVDRATDRVVETSNGPAASSEEPAGVGDFTDTVVAAITYSLGDVAFVENLTLSGTATSGTGNVLNNVITGNARANGLSGLGGADTVSGGAGRDTLTGGTGNDVLTGGTGNDRLGGGTGADKFAFDTALNATSNRDVITDFVVVDDTIQLDRTIFKKIATGDLAPGAFYRGAAAHDASDRIIYNRTNGNLYYDADGSGNASSAVLFATLTTEPALAYTDFFIVT